MTPQGGFRVFGPEDPTRLQNRHDPVDEHLEPSGQIGRHDVEAVRGALVEPFGQLVRDLLRCPGKCPMPTATAEFADQFTDGEVFALRKVFDELVSTLVSLDAIDVRQTVATGHPANAR